MHIINILCIFLGAYFGGQAEQGTPEVGGARQDTLEEANCYGIGS